MTVVRSGRFDPALLVVGAFVAVSGALLLLEPVVDPIGVFGVEVRPFVLSAVVLAAGFGIGAVVFFGRGRRLVGFAHAIGASGFGLLVGATALGSGTLLLGGVAVLVGGCAFLAARTSHG